MHIVILGLSITSSWGNGHATTYRGLVRELVKRGHQTLFLERDQPWYANNRDLPCPPFGRTEIYSSLEELDRYEAQIAAAELVIVGSYVPEGILVGDRVLAIARGVRAFYDIDTPVTLARLEAGECDYLDPLQIAQYDLYLSFSGGPILKKLEDTFGSPAARAFYCSFDPSLYYPENRELRWDLGYMGTYSDDRQPPLDRLLIEPARRWADASFVVAGPQYPESIVWPPNVERLIHLEPRFHRGFYCSQRFTLNITRSDMVRAGYSPSVRLFEAAACGAPIISDWWEGLDTIFEPGREILIACSPEDTLRYLRETSESGRQAMAHRARDRALRRHTAAHRALELENHALDCTRKRSAGRSSKLLASV